LKISYLLIVALVCLSCSKKPAADKPATPATTDTTAIAAPSPTAGHVQGSVPFDSLTIMPYLEKAKIPYTGDAPAKKSTEFTAGMAAYQSDDFKTAQGELDKAARIEKVDWEVWLYLGSAAYMNGDTRQAIFSFSMVERYSAPAAPREQARWYMANSYLQTGSVTRAKKILQTLAERKGAYAERASALHATVVKLDLADSRPLIDTHEHD
jgi:tetratricopeptide (TPR) repeat protein